MATFYDHFLERAASQPDAVALEIQLRDRVESYTYAETRHKAAAVGHWLQTNGYPASSRIAILAANHPRWVVTYLGAVAAGCTVVPFDTAFHADQVTKLLKDSGGVLLFCDSKNLPMAQEAVSGMNIPLVITDAKATPNAAPQDRLQLPIADLDAICATPATNFVAIPRSDTDLAVLLYTSGTTADPKGVMLSHGNLMGEINSISKVVPIGPGDAILGLLPLFHSLAQVANLLLPLARGCRIVYLETLNTTELLRALRERDITLFCVVPQFFYLIRERIFQQVKERGALAESALRALMKLNRLLRKIGINAGKIFFRPVHTTLGGKMRFMVTGGSRFDPTIARELSDLGVDVLQAYGLTETCGGALVTPPGHIVIGSVGKPFPGNQAMVVDPQPLEDGGQPAGEIAIRGPIVMQGYWNRPDATAQSLRDGWLYTGDLGYFDSDGNLFITGRKKEMIVLSNGKNIYPEEIEAHYIQSPFIKELCVMALEAHPGDPTSERLHGVIVPNFDVLKQRKIVNAREVIRFDIEGLSPQIASTKRLGSYEIWQEDLPRTTTRKLKRFEIEKRVRANQGKTGDDDVDAEKPLTPEEIAWLERSDVQQALAVIRQRARNAPARIAPANNLELDLGLDSMQRVELLAALEEELGGDVEEARISEIYSVRELVDAVLDGMGSGQTRAPRTHLAGWTTILQEDPTDPAVLDLARTAPFRDIFWFSLTRLVQMIARDRFDLKVAGLEKLPLNAPYILCSNHQSYLDPVVLGSLLPWNAFSDSFAIGTSDLFGSGLMNRIARWLRVVVVDPDANLVPAMKAGAFGLRHGRILMLYPEGERSIDGTPKTFRKGAAILSIHLQAPIVPIAIEGFYEAWPRHQKSFQKFTQLRMMFGDPIYPPPASQASEAAYDDLTATLKAKIVAMRSELHSQTPSAT